MDVCVLSNDLIFFSGVEGVAGAMGHKARQVGSIEEIGAPDLLIADFVSLAVDVKTLAGAFDPLRTAIFTPHERVEVFAAARGNGVAHVYRRGALAVELPRILAEYATGADDGSAAFG
ncbi:MAG: hypothetical protein ACRDG3_11175 [Tepidiformaceae bacterium]